ncbi:hypothetical protein DL98DRAFT_97335 [Cadophora sp. DSE1049]|nr:hypothetical protein DL98DRAFT_97335 [Cadophora sp. DSE1049]
MNIMNPRLVPRISRRGIRHPHAFKSTCTHRPLRFSTSSILREVNKPDHRPEVGQQPSHQTIPPERPRRGTDRASSVIFWIGGVAVIFGAWKLERRFWRGEAQPRVGV